VAGRSRHLWRRHRFLWQRTRPRIPLEQASATGTIYAYSCTKIASIADGTSNTMLFSERPYGLLESDPAMAYASSSNDYWWNSGYWGHTNFDTSYAPNALRKNKALFDAGWWWLADEAAGSFHAGGVNVSMADGSVRFIKDTISCWPNDVANYGPDIQRRFSRARNLPNRHSSSTHGGVHLDRPSPGASIVGIKGI
jgi:prepilin-type processing-associated H-X9-DG protein